jgi:hypothetical protein
MSYPFSHFHTAMRALIGDTGSLATGYDYASEQLDGALATVVNMGFAPCVTLDPQGGGLSAAPPNRATWAFLATKAAHLLVGGSTPASFRTRALSVTVEASGRRDTLSHIEAILSELEASGNICGTADDESYKGLLGVANDLITSSRLWRSAKH